MVAKVSHVCSVAACCGVTESVRFTLASLVASVRKDEVVGALAVVDPRTAY